MAGNGALVEDDAAFRIDPGRDEGSRHFPGMGGKGGGILRRRQRMQIDDAVNALETLLQPDPVSERAQVITKMQIPGRLHAGKAAFHVSSSRGALSGGRSLPSSLRLVKRAFPEKRA